MSSKEYQALQEQINRGAVEELSRLGYTPETLFTKCVYATIAYLGEGKVDVQYAIVGKWNIKRVFFYFNDKTIRL